jgi:hypothetical protein
MMSGQQLIIVCSLVLVQILRVGNKADANDYE